MNDEALNPSDLAWIFIRNLKLILITFLFGLAGIFVYAASIPEVFQANVKLETKGYINEKLADNFEIHLNETAQDSDFRKWLAGEMQVDQAKVDRVSVKINYVRNEAIVDLSFTSLEPQILQQKSILFVEEFIKRFSEKFIRFADKVIESETFRKNQIQRLYQVVSEKKELNKSKGKLDIVRLKRDLAAENLNYYIRKHSNAGLELQESREVVRNTVSLFNAEFPEGPLEGVRNYNKLNSSTKSEIEKKVYVDLAKKIINSRLDEKKTLKMVSFYRAEIPKLENELTQYLHEESELTEKIGKLQKRYGIIDGKIKDLENKIFSFKEFREARVEFNPKNNIQVVKKSDNRWGSAGGMAILLFMSIVFLVYVWELLLKPRFTANK